MHGRYLSVISIVLLFTATGCLIEEHSANRVPYPCTDGKAFNARYDCQNVHMWSRLSTQQLGTDRLNDVWGWEDQVTGSRYALVGLTEGTAFVEITNPADPYIVGKLPEHVHESDEHAHKRRTAAVAHHPEEQHSVWRDIKVYQNHAFVVSESDQHGMQVFDLTNLRNSGYHSPPQEFSETAHYNQLGSAHNVVINPNSGFAYAVGTNSGDRCAGGGLHIIDISQPANPIFAGCFDEEGYIHDAQAVQYEGPDQEYQHREIVFAANEHHVSIVDVTDKSNPELISKTTYPNVGYVHQMWASEDHAYLIVNDELDEIEQDIPTTSYVWDMSDLDNPQLVESFRHSTQTIDHNLYIQNDYVFESNYTSGLQILEFDRNSGQKLKRIGFFDTYPQNDSTKFSGSWSNYPFYSTDVVVVSDIFNGLFVLEPDLK